MIKINPSNIDEIISFHFSNVEKYINYDVLQNREKNTLNYILKIY